MGCVCVGPRLARPPRGPRLRTRADSLYRLHSAHGTVQYVCCAPEPTVTVSETRETLRMGTLTCKGLIALDFWTAWQIPRCPRPNKSCARQAKCRISGLREPLWRTLANNGGGPPRVRRSSNERSVVVRCVARSRHGWAAACTTGYECFSNVRADLKPSLTRRRFPPCLNDLSHSMQLSILGAWTVRS